MPRPDPQEALDFLERHPDVEAIQVLITDLGGVARGKSLAREELEPLYRNGRNVAGSILGLDTRGEDVEETGLVWSVGDADKLCWPVPGTLRPAPWLARPGAQLLMGMYEADGTPATADPRHALAQEQTVGTQESEILQRLDDGNSMLACSPID